jgi:hypothetical protein
LRESGRIVDHTSAEGFRQTRKFGENPDLIANQHAIPIENRFTVPEVVDHESFHPRRSHGVHPACWIIGDFVVGRSDADETASHGDFGSISAKSVSTL